MSGPLIAVVSAAETKTLNGGTALIALQRPKGFPDPAPGQFAKLRILDSGPGTLPLSPRAPLLDRPFSFHRADPERLFFLVRRKGEATAVFQKLKPGARIKLTGPLGRIEPGLLHLRGPLILASGGIGLGPMGMFGDLPNSQKLLIYGEDSASSLIDADYLASLSKSAVIFTRDGSSGRMGFLTAGLSEALKGLSSEATVFACGPPLMLKEIQRICRNFQKARLFVSAEAFMACGLGVCLSCSAETSSARRVRICRDGPVFPGGCLKF